VRAERGKLQETQDALQSLKIDFDRLKVNIDEM
jgi:hypothetical protein